MANQIKALKEKINSLKDEQKSIVENALNEVRTKTSEEDARYNEIEEEIRGLEDVLAKANEERYNPENKVENVKEDDKMSNMEKRERLIKGMKDILTDVPSAEAEEFRAAANTEVNGITLPTSAPAGKNIIPTELADEILLKLEEHSDIFARVRKYPSVEGNLNLPARIKTGECGFVGENEAVKAIKVKYEVVTLTQKRCGAFARVTRQLMLDAAFDMMSQVIEVLVDDLAKSMERAIFQGNPGEKSFDGINNHIHTADTALTEEDILKSRKILNVASANQDVVTADDLMKVYVSLHPSFLASAKWTMSRDFFNKIAMLKDGNGNFLLQSGIINGKPNYSLFGSPVEITDELGGTDKFLNCYFGDLGKAYAMMIKRGMTIARVNSDTEAILHATELVAIDIFADGTVVNPQAVVAFTNKQA